MATTLETPAAGREPSRPVNPTRLRIDAWLLAGGLSAIPVSIAVCEILLFAALAWRMRSLVPKRLPQSLWFWLAWALMEVAWWLRSPDLRAGLGEMRHLVLISAVLLALPALRTARQQIAVWRGIIVAATVSSLVLIAQFAARLHFSHGTADPAVYLRGGGLLHHWMIYSVVEILVFAALLELWRYFPEDRGWLVPVFLIHGLAIVLSLTRTLWVCCLLLLFIYLVGTRSRWILALPVIPCVLWFAAPAAVRSRVTESADSNYYSNAERLQMLRVGWRMVRRHPWTGVGAGRVEGLYSSYLTPSETLPAYHGHLHNNAVELAAEFGWPVLGAAGLFVLALVRDLVGSARRATSRHRKFLCRTAILGLTGFLAAGLFDFTYGHALALILLTYTVTAPLQSQAQESRDVQKTVADQRVESDSHPADRRGSR